jgi:hypothetical protein
MRALCGAVITAGALIGIGLLGIGMGTRYANFADYDVEGREIWVKFSHMDTPLQFMLVFLVVATIVGLGIAFFGLALHNERRYRERLHDMATFEEESSGGKKSKRS